MSEPTTHPGFIDLARALKSVGIHLRICSNGDLHDDNYWNDLGSILDDNDRVWFTLCGSTQAMHEHYRVGTTLHKVLQHARALRTIKKVDGARALVFKYNENDIHSAEMKIIL